MSEKTVTPAGERLMQPDDFPPPVRSFLQNGKRVLAIPVRNGVRIFETEQKEIKLEK